MREKLELMRQKKQEYLQYQRQVALQRMQVSISGPNFGPSFISNINLKNDLI
jgi:hypothetical protein